jgi:hypothetical protein
MKNFLLVVFCFACYGTLIAQNKTTRLKYDIERDIWKILFEKEKTYMKDGRYNVVYFSRVDDRPGYSLFQCYDAPVKPGEESSRDAGWQKIWIDFSKVKFVQFTKTRYGYDCIYIYSKPYGIVSQRSRYISYANSTTQYNRGAGDAEYLEEISLPIGNQSLKGLFTEYAAACKVEYDKNTAAYPIMKLPEKQKTKEELDQEATNQYYDELTEFIQNFKWEFTGGSTSIFNADKRDRYFNITEKKMNVDYVRMNFVLGNKKIRLNISPIGFYWVDLPYYKKYNEQNVMVATGEFSQPRFYAPTIGLIYCMIPKADRNDDYRVLEFPLAINFSPFMGVKNTGFSIANVARDSEFKNYLAPFNYVLSGTIGANIYPGDGLGFSLNTGVSYLGINATNKEVYETDANQRTNTYTIKMDKAKKLLANFELKFLIRF